MVVYRLTVGTLTRDFRDFKTAVRYATSAQANLRRAGKLDEARAVKLEEIIL